jgi:hypothetical protein
VALLKAVGAQGEKNTRCGGLDYIGFTRILKRDARTIIAHHIRYMAKEVWEYVKSGIKVLLHLWNGLYRTVIMKNCR